MGNTGAGAVFLYSEVIKERTGIIKEMTRCYLVILGVHKHTHTHTHTPPTVNSLLFYFLKRFQYKAPE